MTKRPANDPDVIDVPRWPDDETRTGEQADEYYNWYCLEGNKHLGSFLIGLAIAMNIPVRPDLPVIRMPSKSTKFHVSRMKDEREIRKQWLGPLRNEPEVRVFAPFLRQHFRTGVWLGAGPDGQLVVYDEDSDMGWVKEISCD
jgi:hypothetical protein